MTVTDELIEMRAAQPGALRVAAGHRRGPAGDPAGDPAGAGTAGTANSVTTPAVVIRPTSPGTPVNQSAPSGPAVMALGPLATDGASEARSAPRADVG